MIKDPHGMVKDFRTGQMVKRQSESERFERCAGCGKRTRHHDHMFGWNVCLECDSDEVAADIADHVMNPNRGLESSFY